MLEEFIRKIPNDVIRENIIPYKQNQLGFDLI